jgi:serine/threonine protein kinase
MYIVSELCVGGSLRDLVLEQMMSPGSKKYTDADALRWCIDLAQALEYLHHHRQAQRQQSRQGVHTRIYMHGCMHAAFHTCRQAGRLRGLNMAATSTVKPL